MEVIRRVPPTCNCYARLEAFATAEEAAGRTLDLGSEVACDCGLAYKLVEHQFDGPGWQKVIRR